MFINDLFYGEPAGAFSGGHIFKSAPDLASAQQDPDNGYWHCDVADQERLTWSEKVYELFGLPAGSPIERQWAVGRYSEGSRRTLEKVRTFGLNRKFGFILDARLDPMERAAVGSGCWQFRYWPVVAWSDCTA